MTIKNFFLTASRSRSLVVAGLAAVLLVLHSASLGFNSVAPDRIWSQGVVLDVEATRKLLQSEGEYSTAKVRQGTVYAIRSDSFIYLTEEITDDKQVARLGGNSQILFFVDGNNFYILDNDGKEREAHVIRAINLTQGQGAKPISALEPPSRAAGVVSSGQGGTQPDARQVIPPLRQTAWLTDFRSPRRSGCESVEPFRQRMRS